MGAATAFFLCDRGATGVLVLERGQLGAGSTKGGLGGIRHRFEDELDIRDLSLERFQTGRRPFKEAVL